MNSKERILKALRGEAIDRVPFSPFLAYWWEAQSPEFQKQGQYDFMKSVGADPLLRGFTTMFNIEHVGCEIIERIDGIKKYTEHRTPKGSIFSEHTYVASGNTWFLTKHPIDEIEQLEIFNCYIDSIKVTPNYKNYEKITNNNEYDALLLPAIGVFTKSAFQTLLEHWIGTENLIYMLYDNEKEIMDTLSLMWEKDEKTVEISADSPADGFIFWEDSSTTNINPEIFDKCTAPELRDWANIIHKRDKLLVHHACGNLNDLIVPMSKTGIDVVESITPPPTGNIEIDAAFSKIPENIALIGGIEPVFFLNCTLEELEIYVKDLLAKTKGRRFVLANSDSCPPGVSVEKFRLVADIVAKATV